MVGKTKAPSALERWALIPGFGGLYRVSDQGRVQTKHRYGSRSGETTGWWDMSQQMHDRGYVKIGLGPHGKRRSRYVHRLVAKAFVPNPRGYPAINHLDGNKKNNAARNLEWCTNAQNTRHAMSTGLMMSGYQHPLCKLTPGQIVEIRARLDAGMRVAVVATAFEVCRQTIYDIRNRSRYADVI